MMALVILSLLLVLVLLILSPLGALAMVLLVPVLVVAGFKWGRSRASGPH